MSLRVMRPPFPVPEMLLRSWPCVFAKARTAGEANTFPVGFGAGALVWTGAGTEVGAEGLGVGTGAAI